MQKPSLDGFFALHLNNNIAFSLPLNYFIFYPLIFIILFCLISFWLQSLRCKNILIWPWGLLIIGAISNLLDRWHYGGVVDFIDPSYFISPAGSYFVWPVFNLADVYIFIGALWLLVYYLFFKKNFQSQVRS